MELVNHLKSIAFPGVTLIYMQSGINGTQWARWWRNIPATKPQSLNLYKFDLDRVGLIFQLWFPSLAGCRCATYSTKMSWSVALPAVVERPNFRILNWMNRMNNDVILVQPCIRSCGLWWIPAVCCSRVKHPTSSTRICPSGMTMKAGDHMGTYHRCPYDVLFPQVGCWMERSSEVNNLWINGDMFFPEGH